MPISSDNCKLCGKPIGECPNTLARFLLAHSALVEMQEDLELAGVEPPEPKADE